ncbi:hypothetical protein MBLNU457_1583t1 [Dothideomycetes sp. NU457]
MASIHAQSDFIASSPTIQQHELNNAYNHDPYPQAKSPASPDMSQSGSVASDGFSIASSSTTSPPYIFGINPSPAYISQESAAQIATEAARYQDQYQEEGQENAEIDGRAAVSERAVAAVNVFLDKVLHDVLSLARTTQLSTLRSAVAEILKKNLARDTIAFADANLEDLLAAEDEEEEEDERPTTQDSTNRWNLEYVWKRARLRVMMRSEKSDFDIDDDDKFVQQEGLVSPERRFSETATVISLSSEIFLAGVLDFLAESIFVLATGPAISRVKRNSKKSVNGTTVSQHFIVEETDVEKAILNSPIDRLWRNWRRSLRTRGFGISGSPLSPRHEFSPSMTSTPSLTRRGSQPWGSGPYAGSELPTPRGIPGEFIETPAVEKIQQDVVPRIADHDFPEHILASNIPVPITDRDVDEIEVPGLARDPDEAEEREEVEPPRRKSYAHPDLFATRGPAQLDSSARPAISRQRSNSEPHVASEKTRQNNTIETTTGMDSSAVGGETMSPEAASNIATGRHAAITPHTLPAGVAIAGVAAGGTAAIAAAAAIQASSHPLDKVTFSTDPHAIEAPPKSSARLSSVPDEPYPIEQSTDSAEERTTPAKSSPQKARNRETSIGVGSRNGIVLPQNSGAVNEFDKSAIMGGSSASYMSMDPFAEPNMLIAGGSDTEGSDLAKSPRDFLAKRNIHTTRSSGSTSTLQTIRQSNAGSKVSMVDTDQIPVASSPVSPMNPVDRSSRFSEATRLLKSERQSSRSPSTSPKQMQEEFSKSRNSTRTSPKIGQKDFGSDALTAMPRRESSLRRLAVDRHGSLVSLVDESSNKIRPKMPLTSSSITSVEDFDSLLAGGETIKMTLSPSTVRDTPSPASSRQGSIDHTVYRSRMGSREDVTKPVLSKRPTLSTVNSYEGHRAGSPLAEDRGRSGSVATTKSGRSSSRPAVRNKSKTRAGLQAREPTVQTDSTRDFADFIRSTGPDKEPQTLVPALTTRKASVRNVNTGSTPVPAVSQNAGIKIKSSLQAREPKSENSGSSDLAALIRGGPNDKSPNHSTASFAREARNSASTTATVATYNSRAPLVPNGNAQPAYMSTTPTQNQMKASPASNDGRTRYRNKDPYAIDISDEDEDDEDNDLTALPKQGTTILPERKQSTGPAGGSLGDFLRTENVTTSTDSALPASGLALDGVAYNPSSYGTTLPLAQPEPTIRPAQITSTISSTSDTTAPKKGYIPRNPYRKTSIEPTTGPRSARMNAIHSSGTADLADFLRNSGPDVRPAPKPLSAAPVPATAANRAVGAGAGAKREFSGGAPSPNIGGGTKAGEKEKKGKFWQRSKRYADLP